MVRLAALIVALLCAAGAGAQTPPPAAPLPDASSLPDMPGNLRMPGADHRECGPSKWSALCPAGRWTHFSRIDLDVTAPGSFNARYEIEQAANGEMHVTYREQRGKELHGGEIVLFGTEGLAYRSREKFPDPANIIDYMLTTPILMSRLSALLLDLGFLGPPSEVGAPQGVKASNDSQYLRTDAPRKAVLYGAPWSMNGTVRRAGPDKVGFSLRLTYRPVDRNGNALAGKTEAIRLEGTAFFGPPRPTLPDSMDLSGWKMMRVGETAPQPSAPTLDEARRALGP
ncbi:MAG: hypothetical protein U1F41_11555 [Burkholderiales bacterium]